MPKDKTKKLGIYIQLEDDDAKLFLNFKKKINIKSSAEAARKLMLDQLQLQQVNVIDQKKSITQSARELAA